MAKRNNSKRKSSTSITKQVRSIMNARLEHKYYNGVNTSLPGTGGATTYITSIGQGLDEGGRSGDAIRPLSLNIDTQFTDTVENSYRYVIVQDKLNTGTAPSWSSIFADTIINSAYSNVGRATKRFKILCDVRLNTSSSGEKFVTHRNHIKLKGDIWFTGTDNTSASSGKNSLWMFSCLFANTGTLDQRRSLEYTDA